MEVSESTSHEVHCIFRNEIDKALEAFMNYQQEADKRFWEAEEERGRREEERDEKRRKEDQEFFLKLMQALNK